MSLRPEPVGEIPAETVRVARAAFPKGTLITRLRDEFSALYQDEDFRHLYPTRGQPGLTPWRLALVTVFQFLEHLSDRQAALGFKWSSQHLGRGGCDDRSEAALGSVRARRLALARSALCCAA
jgi:hypothetical protein